MAISDAQASKINKMNRASQEVGLGNFIQGLQNGMGKYVVTAADVTATKSIINTGKTITGQIVSIMRSNLQLSGAKVTFSATNLQIETNGTTYVLTAGDVVNYIVF